MVFSEAFRKAYTSRGYSQRALAEEAGVKQPAISSMLYKGNPSVNVICRYVRIFGYELALVPSGAKLPEGSYVLEADKGAEE